MVDAYMLYYWFHIFNAVFTRDLRETFSKPNSETSPDCVTSSLYLYIGTVQPLVDTNIRIHNKLTLAVSLAQSWEDHLSLDRTSRDDERQPALPASHTLCRRDDNRFAVSSLDAGNVCPTLCSNFASCTLDTPLLFPLYLQQLFARDVCHSMK